MPPSEAHSLSSTQVDLSDHVIAPPAPISAKPAAFYTLRKTPFRVYVTPFERILNHKYSGSGTSEDPFIVDWLPDDPEDPQRWPTWYKWYTIAIVSVTTLAVALSSSAYSGGVVSLIEDFGASQELLTAGISLFVVGFAFGPLVWAPMSEIFGRRKVYIVSYFFLTLWTAISAASQTVAQLLVFRFLSGLFGSSPLANAGGTIFDVLDVNQRGLGMALFAAAPFLGPALGPITGGFLGESAGWRWIEGFLAIFCGVIFIILLCLNGETYAPALLRDRAATLSSATGQVYRFRADAKQPLQIGALLKASVTRPWKFLIFEPIVSILTLYTAVIYGVLYLNFSAYPFVFQRIRGWSTGIGGLAFLGVLVGTVVSVITSVVYINPQYIRTAKKRGGRATPEDRLPPAIWGGLLIVIGLAGFAATDGPEIPWIAPILFGIPFGTGVIVVFLAVMSYLVDSYTIYAASVLAANSVLRSLFGAAFPLFTTQMYENLGIHWAAALPAFIALAMIPFTVVFYKYGAVIRKKCKYAADAERQMAAIMAARHAQEVKSDEEKAAGGFSGSASKSVARPQDDQQARLGAQPAERLGGEGNLREEARELTSSGEHEHHEWTTYEALADRDEVDLTDDERIRLESLHEKFDYAKAKSTDGNKLRASGNGSTASTNPISLAEPVA